MKIIQPSTHIIDESDPYKKIEKIGRLCYKSEDKIAEGSAIPFVNRLKEHGHFAMLEHAYLHFLWNHNYRPITDPFEMFANIPGVIITRAVDDLYLISVSLSHLYNPKWHDCGYMQDLRHWFEYVYFDKSGNRQLRLPDKIDIKLLNKLDDAKSPIQEHDSTIDDSAWNNIKTKHTILSIYFMVDRGCCYDEDTKVLTKDGWKYFRECKDSDEFLTLTDDNEPIYVKANKLISYDYDGILHHWHNTQVDLMVTPNHNMWVFDSNKRSAKTRIWKFVKSEDCTNGRYLIYKSSNRHTTDITSKLEIPSVEVPHGFYTKTYSSIEVNAKLFMELLGWWVTDGSVSDGSGEHKCGNRITISQTKVKGRQRIKYLLDELGFDYYENAKEYRVNCPQLYRFLRENFTKSNDTRKTYYLKLPRWIFNLDNDCIKSFLDGVIGGNGSKNTKSDTYQIYTKSWNFAEDLVELYMFIGQCANIRKVAPRTRVYPSGHVSECGEQYVVSQIKTTKPMIYKNRISDFEQVYHGKVYCAELPVYHKLYVMRNGKACWCGNSHELVRHRCSVAQSSTRYCNYAKEKFGSEITYIEPSTYAEWTPDVRDRFESYLEDCENLYMYMINSGLQPQQARAILPNALMTEVVLTMSIDRWEHFFDMRSRGITGKPHPDMKFIADKAIELFTEYKNNLIK